MATRTSEARKAPPPPPPRPKPKTADDDTQADIEADTDDEQSPREALGEALDNIERWAVIAHAALDEIEEPQEQDT